MIQLEVIGLPTPKGSFVRMANGATVMGTSKTGRQRMAEWERAVADAARAFLVDHPQQPLTGPFAITIYFRFPATKSNPHRYWHSIKPDIDKLARLTLDALKLGGLIGDDCQACDLRATKRFVLGDESPGCSIEINSLTHDEESIQELRRDRARAARQAHRQSESLPL